MHSNRICRERSIEEISTDESNRGTRSPKFKPVSGKKCESKLQEINANAGSKQSVIQELDISQ